MFYDEIKYHAVVHPIPGVHLENGDRKCGCTTKECAERQQQTSSDQLYAPCGEQDGNPDHQQHPPGEIMCSK